MCELSRGHIIRALLYYSRRKWKLSVGLGFEGQRHLARLCAKMEYLKKGFLYTLDVLDMSAKVSETHTTGILRAHSH